MNVFEIVKVIVIGIIEGITEWLPVSSTGHILLLDAFLPLHGSPEFKSLFFIVIQLAAVCAVIVLFWKDMFPFRFHEKKSVRKDVFLLWFKTLIACIPGAAAVFLFGDFVEERLHTAPLIAAALIFYGLVFIVIERTNKKRTVRIDSLTALGYKTAFIIGLFQVLSVVPGTSRSGATIIGALLIGVSRTAAAEFTFFLAVPVMLGSSFLKLFKYGIFLGTDEMLLLLIGCAVAFFVSLATVRFLMGYIKKHDFTLFGVYRIIAGLAVLLLLRAD